MKYALALAILVASASIAGAKCYGDGPATFQGIASAENIRGDDGATRSIWVLATRDPTCLATASGQVNAPLIQILGSPPPLGVPIELTGRIITNPADQHSPVAAALFVTKGRKIASADPTTSAPPPARPDSLLPAAPPPPPPVDPAIAEREAAAKKRDEALAANLAYEKDHGYERTTIDDFELDGKELMGRGAKLSISGYYVQIGENQYLISPDQMAMYQAQFGRISDVAIGLLTDDAERPLRQYFLQCRKSQAMIGVGCPVTILGRAVVCKRTTLIAKTIVPCVDVDTGWTEIRR